MDWKKILLDAGIKTASMKTGVFTLRQLKRWASGSDAQRLLNAIDRELANDASPLEVDWSAVRQAPDFLAFLYAFQRTEQIDRERLIEVIEPSVGPASPGGEARSVAEHVADLVIRLAFQAMKDERAGLHSEIRRARNDVVAAVGEVRFLTLKGHEGEPKDRLLRLANASPKEAGQLDAALKNSSSAQVALGGLVANPPGWLSTGTGHLWECVAGLFSTYGLFPQAEAAFLEAAERPEVSRARMFAQAAEHARVEGSMDRFEAHLALAEAADADEPVLRLLLAVRAGDPARTLELLDGLETSDEPRLEARIQARRAEAHIALGDFDSARKCIAAGESVKSDDHALREVAAMGTLLENQAHLSAGLEVSWPDLEAAAGTLLALRDELRALGRYEQSAAMVARAAEAYVLAGERRQAGQLLAGALEEERTASKEAAYHLAHAALESARPDLIEGMIVEPTTDRERFVLLEAQILTLGEEGVGPVVAGLEELLDSTDHDIRVKAANACLWVAAASESIKPNQKAVEIISDVDPILVAVTTAVAHERRGEFKQAETVLLPHSADHRISRALVELAFKSGNAKKALVLLGQGNAGEPASLKLLRAQALHADGQARSALAVLQGIQNNPGNPSSLRIYACGLGLDIALEIDDFELANDLAAHFLVLAPSNQEVRWARIYSLRRLGRYEEALEEYRAAELRPRAVEDARLAADLLRRSAPVEDAVSEIAALSEALDEPDDQVEAQLLMAGTRARKGELGPELEELLRERWARFPERFPESQVIRAIPAPQSDAEAADFVKTMLQGRSAHGHEVVAQVAAGEAPIALLAHASGRDIGAVMMGHPAIPLAFCDQTLADLELRDAQDAIGTGAVWDSSALYVARGLGEDIADSIVSALNASYIPQSVLDDLGQGVDNPQIQSGSEEPQGSLALTPDGEPVLIEHSSEDIARAKARAEGMAALAQRLTTTPDSEIGDPTELAEFLSGSTAMAGPMRTWLATLAVAQRTGLAVFSDDRYVRLSARRAGIAAFGSVAVLAALADRGVITAEQLSTARQALWKAGVTAVQPSLEELLELARRGDWHLDHALRQLLLNTELWRAHPTETCRVWIDFLRIGWEEAPHEFDTWVARLVDGFASALSLPRGSCAQVVLMLAWLGAEDEPAFLSGLIAAIRASWTILGTFDDPVLASFIEIYALWSQRSPQLGQLFSSRVLRQIGFKDAMNILLVVGLEIAENDG